MWCVCISVCVCCEKLPCGRRLTVVDTEVTNEKPKLDELESSFEAKSEFIYHFDTIAPTYPYSFRNKYQMQTNLVKEKALL